MAKEKAPNIPVVEESPVESDVPKGASDEDYKDGQFVDRETNEKFALCIHDADDYGRTHSLKNSLHFYQCTEEEFRQKFDKA